MKHIHNQDPAIQTVENAIQWMRLYPLDKDIRFPNTYSLDVVIYLLDSTIQHLNKQGRLVYKKYSIPLAKQMLGTLRSTDVTATRTQKEKRFISKTTTLHVHHTFLYISLRFLHY